VAWLVDRSPLPMEPSPLTLALAHRIGEVLEGANLRYCAVGAGGILAVIRRGRATLLLRGAARAYLLRSGELRAVLHEHVLGREPGAAEHPETASPAALHYWVRCSMFEPRDREGTSRPLEFDVAQGDRLIFVTGTALLQALEDPERERLLTAAVPDPAGLAASSAGLAASKAMIEDGWGVVAVDIGDPRDG
jgi:hypothetical protein